MNQRPATPDRELDAILARLDRLTEAVETVARRLDNLEGIERMSRELAVLSRSLESLAFAALGTRGPHVRREREG